MKEEAIQLADNVTDPVQRLNILREYLQALVLRSLHESEGFKCIAFVGGTALRFLYGLRRFSEDLDFSLTSGDGYRPEEWMKKVKRDLAFAGMDSNVSFNDRKTVHTAWVRVGEVLKETGLAGVASQKLSIKVEIDTRPPGGALTRNQVVERHRMFAVNAYDLPSLMAGKLHALITRKYPKGRDWYDFVWYAASRPPIEPNVTLLQNALDQTEGPAVFDASQWRADVERKVGMLDVSKLRDDVTPFLEHQKEADLITQENLLSLLRR